MGEDKYVGLSRKYYLGEIKPPTAEQMEVLLEVVLKEGLQGQIGG